MPELPDRVTRLEEHADFASREAEALSRELFETNKRLDEALKRIDRLEGRVSEVRERIGADGIPSAAENERPPHAAGPARDG